MTKEMSNNSIPSVAGNPENEEGEMK